MMEISPYGDVSIVMLLPLSLTLTLAGLAAYIRFHAQDEIMILAATGVAIVCLFISIAFVPLVVKLLLLTLPLINFGNLLGKG